MRQNSRQKRKFIAPDTEKKNSFKFADVISFAALFLTITTALLYYFGSTFYSGYLSYWGLPEEMFSLSREKSLIFGIFAYVLLCVSDLMHYLMPLVAIAEALVVVVLLFSFKPIKDFLFRKIQKVFLIIKPHIARHVDMSDATERIINRIIAVILVFASPLILAAIIALSSHLANKQGRENAKQEHNKILAGHASKGPFTSQAMLFVKNETKGFDQYSGYLIQTSATHCSIYNQANGVMIFPLANVSRMIIHENKNILSKQESNRNK